MMTNQKTGHKIEKETFNSKKKKLSIQTTA